MSIVLGDGYRAVVVDAVWHLTRKCAGNSAAEKFAAEQREIANKNSGSLKGSHNAVACATANAVVRLVTGRCFKNLRRRRTAGTSA
jgi:hypothetical protein